MQPADAFNHLLKSMVPLLKRHGYSRTVSTFRKRQDRNWGIINFQKSVSSNRFGIRFTVNLGVYSQTIAEFLEPLWGIKSSPKPIEMDCHWRRRIGSLLSAPGDHWWNIFEDTPIDPLMREIQTHVMERAVPEIERHISDEQLMDFCLSSYEAGNRNFQMLRDLAILLNASGKSDVLKAVLLHLEEESTGKPTEKMAKAIVHKIQSRAEGSTS